MVEASVILRGKFRHKKTPVEIISGGLIILFIEV
jgi:hypothetical protein|tara:strand:+ start:112 stop:213 length:102 start_codon:yes stop_codon:yes gene_type:complete